MTSLSLKRIVIKTMSRLHQQGNVSTQFDSKLSTVGLDCIIPDVCFFFTVINGRLGPTNAGILGRDL